jgi:putative membrane protein
LAEHEPAGTSEPDVRFSLANERTLLAYQRTAIGLMAAAIAVVHFLAHDALVLPLAAALIVTGVIAAVGGYQHYRHVERAIREGSPVSGGPAAHVLSLAMLVCLAITSIYVLLRAT